MKAWFARKAQWVAITFLGLAMSWDFVLQDLMSHIAFIGILFEVSDEVLWTIATFVNVWMWRLNNWLLKTQN